MRAAFKLLVAVLVPAMTRGYATTDSIQDADGPQSGYLPNHNIDPNVVGSSSFGILWQQQMATNTETFYAKPLVYTQSGGSEMVITASNINYVRIHDAKNGTLLASRQLTAPFLQADIGCADIPNYIGVTGTPIIDPKTDIIYMFAKGYRNGAASGGIANGIYQLYALQLPTLADAPGFPVLLDGRAADNDPTRYFLGGTVLQRPSLATLNGVIVAAFGGHCDLFNYTGMVATISKTPGVGVVSLFATEASPGAPSPQALDITKQNGGKAGIWQSGMGLATDSNRVFGVTGNGQGHANGNIPASGRLPLTTLDECVINFGVSSAGKITLNDYFEPYDYVNMDAGDKDLGSSGTCLLDGSVFKTAGVNRIAVVVGKNSKVYVLNADGLGGFKQGSGGTDNILQTITSSNSVFGGAGSYPLEGGYFYFTPVGDYTYAYRFGTDSLGAPFFSLAGKTATKSAGRAGVGQPTVTTYGGKAGTAILWITDVTSGLQAFSAVPDANGLLNAITLPATPGLNKYQRPAFGNGRVFVTSANKIIALGAPVNLPLNCSSPTDFGSVQTGDTKDAIINCTANIAITKIEGCKTGDAVFQCNNASLPTGALAKGASFSFPVTWNLKDATINNLVNSSYSKVIPGVESTVLSVYTTNGVKGYTTLVPISLTGQVVSKSPFLFTSPGHVDFGGLVLGSAEASNGLTGSLSVQNLGNSTMTITGISWTAGNDTTARNATFNGTNAVFGRGFSAMGFPAPGSTIQAGGSISVPLFFNATVADSYSITITVYSDGGVDEVLLAASAGNPPIASIEVSTLEGGWDNSYPSTISFGTVFSGSTTTRQIRICNSGGSVLTITKSKPPQSAELTATRPYGDLLEGQKIDVGSCAYGTVAVYAASIQPNHPAHSVSLAWTLNTDGLSALDPTQQFGVHDVAISATIVSRQVGPLQTNGTGLYQWVGCFYDGGRNLQTQINNSTQQATNTIEQCQTLCMNAGYALAGVEYQKECWCGNTIKMPNTYTNDSLNLCTFACTGDPAESCGGDGTYVSMYADVTRFDIPGFLANRNSSSSTGGTGGASGTQTTPTNPASINGTWNYNGCYLDNVNNQRTLKNLNTAADTTTLESCATFCAGYNFFGTEYGRECYCGYTLNATLKASAADCSTACAGNSTELCGAGSRLSVYNNTVYTAPPPDPSHVPQAGNYSWMGCYSEATQGRALSSYAYSSDTMTVEVCAAFCASKGTQMMGIEYARECYCGNTLGVGSQLGATSNCNMLCKNNKLEYCGSGGNLDLYTFLPIASTSTSILSTSTSLSSIRRILYWPGGIKHNFRGELICVVVNVSPKLDIHLHIFELYVN
ncbi:WSC-domain-containing protein [Thozetella sp. PMI_491]|nr:WSC-domain-containing protein [Thozetella sp. PMI_491]